MNLTARKLHVNAKVPAAGAFSTPVRDIQIPSVENADGTISPIGQPVIPVDVNTDPITYTMPSQSMVSRSGVPEYLRTPTVFNNGAFTAAATGTLWTPATTRRFCLQGMIIHVDAGLAAAGAETITFRGSTTGPLGLAFTIWLPIAASVAHQPPIVIQFPGNGLLAPVVGETLDVNLSAAVTAGTISISFYGTEV